jgi:hypothetical protein
VEVVSLIEEGHPYGAQLRLIGAQMHSTLHYEGHDFSAPRCIDGVTDNTALNAAGAPAGWNFCMSQLKVDDPWLSVQLPPAGSTMSEVVIYNREDWYTHSACSNPLSFLQPASSVYDVAGQPMQT